MFKLLSVARSYSYLNILFKASPQSTVQNFWKTLLVKLNKGVLAMCNLELCRAERWNNIMTHIAFKQGLEKQIQIMIYFLLIFTLTFTPLSIQS
jgi:hypothetical protein